MINWKKILISVDGSETSKRAVQYVGEMVACLASVEICLVHIAPEPHPYYYQEGHSFADYQKEKEEKAQQIFKTVKEDLAEFGLAPEKISTRLYITEPGETVSDAILTVQAENNFGTVVVGKRGVSKAEEFLFGSISNAVVQKCNFTVWVVG